MSFEWELHLSLKDGAACVNVKLQLIYIRSHITQHIRILKLYHKHIKKYNENIVPLLKAVCKDVTTYFGQSFGVLGVSMQIALIYITIARLLFFPFYPS